MSSNDNSNINPLDEKYYRKIGFGTDSTPGGTSYSSDFSKRLADHIIETKIPKYGYTTSDQVRKDLTEINSVRDPQIHKEVLAYIKTDERVEVETQGGTYRADIADWRHYLKRRK